ncbi:MAG TPA: hypothetical protein VIL95_07505, partial [Bacillota bacterium]
ADPGGLWVRLGTADRRRLWWLVAGGLVGLLLVLIGNALTPADHDERPRATTPPPTVSGGTGEPAAALGTIPALEQALSAQLESILAGIEGAGEVRAWVTLDGGMEQVYARDFDETTRRTEENDAQGGKRLIEERVDSQQVVTVQAGSGPEPAVTQVRAASIRGVLVVAQGAADPTVRLRLLRAVTAVLDVPAHRVQIEVGRSEAR